MNYSVIALQDDRSFQVVIATSCAHNHFLAGGCVSRAEIILGCDWTNHREHRTRIKRIDDGFSLLISSPALQLCRLRLDRTLSLFHPASTSQLHREKMHAPSTSLLRALLKPTTCCSQQLRQQSSKPFTGYVDPKKYHKLNALDKLHRRQKEAVRQESQSMSTLPQGNTSNMSTELATYERARSMESPLFPDTTPEEHTSAQSTLPASVLPYTINRTRSSNIPVYHIAKAGGNKHLTQVRKLTGDLQALQSDIRSALGLEQFAVDQQGRKKENVIINWTTKHIVVRGWRGPEIKKWAELRGF